LQPLYATPPQSGCTIPAAAPARMPHNFGCPKPALSVAEGINGRASPLVYRGVTPLRRKPLHKSPSRLHHHAIAHLCARTQVHHARQLHLHLRVLAASLIFPRKVPRVKEQPISPARNRERRNLRIPFQSNPRPRAILLIVHNHAILRARLPARLSAVVRTPSQHDWQCTLHLPRRRAPKQIISPQTDNWEASSRPTLSAANGEWRYPRICSCLCPCILCALSLPPCSL